MASDKSRFQQLEQYMSLMLIGTTVLFVLYFIMAALGIIWLKILLALVILVCCGLCLVYLYLTKLLLKGRSMWMTAAAGGTALCVLFSLILNFPSPL